MSASPNFIESTKTPKNSLNSEDLLKTYWKKSLNRASVIAKFIAASVIKYQILISTLVLSLLQLSLYAIVLDQEMMKNFGFFNLRIFSISFFLFFLSVSLLLYTLNKKLAWRYKIAGWMYSFLFSLVSYIYILLIENASYYAIVITGLVLLGYITYYYQLHHKKTPLLVLASHVFLTLITVFSLLEFMVSDRTTVRDFDFSIISMVFSLPSHVWVFLASLVIGFFTSYNLLFQSKHEGKWLALLAWVLILEFMLAIDTLALDSILYWQKSLMVIIFWDLLYIPFATIISKTKDSKYRPKLNISIVYHTLLIILVFFSARYL